MKTKSYFNYFCVLMIVFFAVCSDGRAEDTIASTNSSACKRSLLCTANAYGYLGEDSESNNVKDRVTDAAVQFAEKKINRYLKKHLAQGETYHFIPDEKMNFQLLSTQKIESSQVGEHLLGIQVTGMVEYQIDGDANDEFLTVSVDSDKSTYHEGDELLFLLHGNQKFHMCLLEDASDRVVTQLLPNNFKPDELFPGGQLLFPSEVSGDSYSFIVGPPFGQSTIHMFGSEEEIGGISVLDETSGDFIQSAESIDTIRSKLMGNAIQALQSNDSQITFQCAQFVESRKKLSLKP